MTASDACGVMARVLRMPEAIPVTAPIVGFAGGGMYVSWILGVAAGMRQLNVPLDRCVFSGASAGAVVAALVASDVDMHAAYDWFLNDPETAACFASFTGAAARVRTVVTTLLTAMLPPDCVRRCNGRLYVLMYSVQRGLYFISDFASKADIISAVVASTHVPYFSDGQFAFNYRGEPHQDAAWLSSRSGVLTARPRAISQLLIDHNDDTSDPAPKLPFYAAANKATHVARFAAGVRYAHRLHVAGKLPMLRGGASAEG